MNLLIDTHALIWFITEDSFLPVETKRIIENRDNVCYVSLASLWEMAIKYSLGRLNLSSDLENIFKIIERSGFELLPVTPSHILTNSRLQFHH